MKKGFFNAEEIGGEYLRFAQEVRRGAPAAVFGVSSATKYLLASVVNLPVLYVTADAASARAAAENLAVLSGVKAEVITAKDEVLSDRKAFLKYELLKCIYGA